MDSPPRTKWEVMEDAKIQIKRLITDFETQIQTLNNSMRDLERLLDPSFDEIKAHLAYFERVCNANNLQFKPSKMRQCIIDYVTYDCGKTWLGCTLSDLVEKGSWEELDLSDTYSRDEIMRLYRTKI